MILLPTNPLWCSVPLDYAGTSPPESSFKQGFPKFITLLEALKPTVPAHNFLIISKLLFHSILQITSSVIKEDILNHSPLKKSFAPSLLMQKIK
jgi:hypothetical protein